MGALDSIADIVGVCAALTGLGITSLSVNTIALGSGQARTAHGMLPVPVPAVLRMAAGWQVVAGGQGECTTPTGMALIAALAQTSGDLPSLAVQTIGVGAGTRDLADRANVTRVVVGEIVDTAVGTSRAMIVEANVDDMDPRLWPGVLKALLDAGADDAWLTPVIMKKGRPAHTLHVLCDGPSLARVRDVVLEHTSTLGMRESAWRKTALSRDWFTVEVDGQPVRIKVGHRGGRMINVATEFADVAQAASSLGLPELVVQAAATAAADRAGLVAGLPLPPR